jgi:pantoate--beta-alanine ligase
MKTGMPEILKTIPEMRARAAAWKREGLSLGLVPTMGFLHAGHRSLIDRARAGNDRVVVSIFVNPIQFGPGEDLAGYPRDLDRDLEVCREAGAEAVFLPAASDMYPMESCTRVDMASLTETLCGASRPGHFQGVLTVVTKLFNIIQPDRAYFGRKDAQQLAVIDRLVRDLDIPVTLVPCPLVREPDGLALSSRNVYLSPEERRAALVLSRSLALGRERLAGGETRADAIKAAMRAMIGEEPLVRLDYLEIVDAATMRPLAEIDRPILAALAAFVGRARLIDNFSWPDPAD